MFFFGMFLVRVLVVSLAILTEDCHGFPQFLYANCRIIPWSGHDCCVQIFFHFVNHPVIEWQLLSPPSKNRWWEAADTNVWQQNTALVCTAVYIQCNKVKLATYFWSAELHVLCRVVVLTGWAVASIVTPFLSACCIPSHLTASETQTEFTWTCYHDFSHVDCPWSWQHITTF
jgi:hypothetical protein